tara:strand:+ start:40 stop:741 length:702 start_codon:yes stop_codon:yes gene_type:complete
MDKYENIRKFYQILTTDKIKQMSGGKIQPMPPEAAMGLIANWRHETGDQWLKKLDTVELDGGAGRGLSQSTGPRRVAYNAAAAKAKAAGIDLNSVEFQMQFFVDEYTGKYDHLVGGKSLIGYSKVLENMPRSGTTEQYARYFSNQYFRPSKSHMPRRLELTKDLKDNIGTPLTFEQQATNTLNKRYPDLMRDVDVNQEPRSLQIRKTEKPDNIFDSLLKTLQIGHPLKGFYKP